MAWDTVEFVEVIELRFASARIGRGDATVVKLIEAPQPDGLGTIVLLRFERVTE